jgi:hypothetical protein
MSFSIINLLISYLVFSKVFRENLIEHLKSKFISQFLVVPNDLLYPKNRDSEFKRLQFPKITIGKAASEFKRGLYFLHYAPLYLRH